MGQKVNIIIDTDPGSDDALALGVASVFFKNNIRAIIATYGNVDAEQTYSNVINLANLLKINTNFIKGSHNPLGKDSFTPTDYHGVNGLCGLVLPKAEATPYDGDFLQDLYDIIKEYKKIRYIAIGPLTNLARLLDRFPDAEEYIDEAVIMGGGFEVTNMPNYAEYNFSTDPAAVKKVLASSVNKLIVPLDTTHQIIFSPADIEDITGVKREALTDDMANPFNVLATLFYLNYDAAVRHNEQGAIIHDATALAYLFEGASSSRVVYNLNCDEYGAVRKYIDHGDKAVVIDRISGSFVKKLLKDTFQAIKENGNEDIIT